LENTSTTIALLTKGNRRAVLPESLLETLEVNQQAICLDAQLIKFMQRVIFLHMHYFSWINMQIELILATTEQPRSVMVDRYPGLKFFLIPNIALH
jgi:hypothetical protein